ncbi:SIMPL domain-containing protein [Niallia sp. NCCP-28]|uniref:SIMPL domain-containing protein n=1 Tax=Niallia sp. NCCP-28 TaxID=2934712 RepID=UPI00200AAEE6|nr:SIMPL domain-containing protein [Niallia sp. NCCP-28]GKU83819.1 oxidative stress defense protein [Niallia sp. NCCP-28]
MHYPFIREGNQTKKRYMTVYGSSHITVEPNIASIQLGVVNEDTELTKAQQKNASLIQQITKALLNQGISKEHIQTADYSIYPQYDFIDNIQQFRGYQVKHLLSITIENISQTGSVIDTAAKNGANSISNIHFSIKNKDIYYNTALKMALNNALEKAQTIAEDLKVHLDSVPAKILEQQTEHASPIAYKAFAPSNALAGASTSIEAGQLQLQAKVEVKFYYYT